MLMKHQNAISTHKEDLGYCHEAECSIDTGMAEPVRLRWRRLLPIKQNAVDTEIASLKRRGLIVDSKSAWAAPLVVVGKKNGEFRVCVDYRELNQRTKKDSYPLPDMLWLLDELGGCSWFSTLDLTSGYLQVPMAKSDQEKTAFCTETGLYEYVVLPYGLCNVPAQFSRVMSQIFANSHGYATIYMDDIIVRAKSFLAALDNLQLVLAKLEKAGLKIRPDKCHLLRRKVKFLGHVVSRDGIEPDPDKTAAVRNWPAPSNTGELASFMGLAGYYQRFIQGYATTAKPLYRLQEKNREWDWTEVHEAAFQSIKRSLVMAPILGYPQFSPEMGEFIIDVDASDIAAGGVLSQVQDGEERVLAYGHKTFSQSQRNYCATMKELLALWWFVVKYKEIVWGCPTLVRTDHRALVWLRKVHSTDKMLSR